MEENAKYAYGATIEIVLGEVTNDFDWVFLARQTIEDALKAEKSYGELHFAYETTEALDRVEIKVLAWEKKTVERIAEAIRDLVGINPRYHKFRIYPPHP